MRLMHEHRHTNSFCILASDAERMTKIVEHFRSLGLNSIAYDHRTDRWTVRLATAAGIQDILFMLDPLDRVVVLERRQIMDFSQVKDAQR